MILKKDKKHFTGKDTPFYKEEEKTKLFAGDGPGDGMIWKRNRGRKREKEGRQSGTVVNVHKNGPAKL